MPISTDTATSRTLNSLWFSTRGAWLPILAVLALSIFFGLSTDSFATWRNLTSISGASGSLLIVSVGATFIVMMGSIDLSVAAIVLLVGAVSVQLVNGSDIGLWIFLVATIIGAVIGLANGLIYVATGIPSFIVTLGSLSIFSGLALQVLKGRAVEFNIDGLQQVAVGQLVPHLPNIALCGLVVWLVGMGISRYTRFGRFMYLIGGGEAVALTAGVRVARYKVYAFVLSGILSGLGAIMIAARLGAVGPSLGQDLLLNSLAAIVVGGTSLSGGAGGPHRTLVGVLIIAILDNGLNLMGVSQYAQMMIKGAAVILAVVVNHPRTKGIRIVK